MNRIYPLAALFVLAASPALIGCGGGAGHVAAASTMTSATVTCAQAKPMIQDLVNAQGKLNASQQTSSDDEMYVIALEEGIAIVQSERWPAVGTQLGSDLHQFESVTSQFTGGDLAVQENVAADISALADDCDIAANG